MKNTDKLPSTLLREVSPGLMEGFQISRDAIAQVGSLDKQAMEMVMLAAFVTAGYEAAVKIHARRLLDMGMPIENIQQIALATFGATTTVSGASRALKWIEEIVDGQGSS
ncbi:carboxymuconolactone decarboxylase family protein [Caballeronia sp. dw_19]|uniref:carboxymuconolactone decarboxylase family protein n=1 Tax=Caballeronia sp. dw_19 TaxID=2719791 RepID=UPI001BD2C845|nr:carboxymuconolactone decarboxylase family protein [Caballeronia sp. dw_19]